MTHGDAVTAPSLWRHADFLKLWTGQTVSELGSVVTRTAVPLVALLVLGAGPTEMALLVVAGSLAVLLVGLFAGAWVDRLRRRPLLIGTDALRSLLLVSIPIAYAAGGLRMEQLYLVTFLEGCLGRAVRCGLSRVRPVADRRRSRRRWEQQARDELVARRDRRPGARRRPGPGGQRPLRDPGRCGVVRRVGGVAAPHPDAGASAAGEDDHDADPAGDRRGPPARPAPSGALSDRDAIGGGSRRWIVLRGPLHDLSHRRPAPDAVPARRRRLGGRRRSAGRLARSPRVSSARWGSARH